MSREMWAQLKKYEDGENLDAKTLNVPIEQLGDRTSYLYSKLKELLSGGTMSSVILAGVGLSTKEGEIPVPGNAVYLDQERQVFAAAKATMSLYDDFKAADSAFSIGILQSRGDGDTGNVLIYGAMNLDPAGAPVMERDMIESGEEFRPGRYYLSANEAGHLTANPSGPLIYVCTIGGGKNTAGGLTGRAIVSPQFLDIGTSHVHRTAVLTARYAGTSSTKGYLPIDDSRYTAESGDSSGSSSSYREVGPLALRFGGVWTSDGKIDYTFYIDQESANWNDGVTLKWKEDGKESESFKAVVHAPDEEVAISHGLTARLSIGSSTRTNAFSGLSVNQRTWETLTFPDAGAGWLDHEAACVARSDQVPGFRVALRGKTEASPSDIMVAFPRHVDVYALGSISDKDLFTYDGVVYEFTKDGTVSSEENVAVPLGTCLADSALYLVQAMSRKEGEDSESSEGASFAVFESDAGRAAKLLILDGSEVVSFNAVAMSPQSELENEDFNVVGARGLNMVIMDAAGRILTQEAVATGISSYSWQDVGSLEAMLYKDSSISVTVPAGTVASATMTDEEPDAEYDYVLGMDPLVANYWPPVPPKSAALMVNGVEMDNKALVPNSPTVSFGRTTIHWFEDDVGRRPWPDALERRDAYIDPACDKTEIMHWVRGFQGATGPVTSLQAKPGSLIKIYGYGTSENANVGDLEIAADFDFQVKDGGAPGFNVPKRARNGDLIAGPVVERVIGGAGVSVISKAGCPEGQGTVIVALDDGAYSSQFSDIALENAEQAKIGMFPYIRLKGYSGVAMSSPSAFTATMRVPANLPDGKYHMRVFASVFGEEGFSGQRSKLSACVKLAYNILPDFRVSGNMEYRNLKTTLLKPDTDRTVLIPFGHDNDGSVEYNGFDPLLVTTEDPNLSDRDDIVAKVMGRSIPSSVEFAQQVDVTPELRPGYLVGIRVSRAVTPSLDDVTPYSAAIGFINLSWALVSAD